VLEALTGQLYLAIMLARLVSLELQSRREGRYAQISGWTWGQHAATAGGRSSTAADNA
jgi:hypothetical protein